MVLLDVMDTIIEYLNEIEIIEDVFLFSDEIIGFAIKNNINDETYTDLISEFTLFNYKYNNKLLIDYLEENLYTKLNEYEKKEFELIKNSERYNLKFIRKEKLNEYDTKKLKLYDYYYKDLENNETKIIKSSTKLENLNKKINVRLIKHPKDNNKFLIIGGIWDGDIYKDIEKMITLKKVIIKNKEIGNYYHYILEYSKNHTLEEIENYNNEKSNFLEQDIKIMKINKKIFEKFGLSINELFKDIFKKSNNKEKLIEELKFFLSIYDEFIETIYNTNYNIDTFWGVEKEYIEIFIAFLEKDEKSFKKLLKKIKENAYETFNDYKKLIKISSRAEIIKNNKNYLNKTIKPLKLKGYDVLINKIEKYNENEIKFFLKEIIDFFKPIKKQIDIEYFDLFYKKNVYDYHHHDELPYDKEIKNNLNMLIFDKEKFYVYMEYDEEIRNFCIFLIIVDKIIDNNLEEAYTFILEERITHNDSYEIMFLLGKVLSFYENKEYRYYFNHAKKIDKERYKKDIEIFIKEKEQGIFTWK